MDRRRMRSGAAEILDQFSSSGGVSIPSLIAASLYVVIALLCIAAWRASHRLRNDRLGRFIWLTISILFAGLALSRLWEWESRIRAFMRGIFESQYSYEVRHDVQAPLALFVIFLLLTGLFLFVKLIRRFRSRRDRNFVSIAVAASIAMVGLVALRIISYHPIDTVLYSGPRLNWWLDIGLSLAVGWAAWRQHRSQSFR